MKPQRKFLPAFIVLILVAAVMNMDHDDQMAQQAHYCEMVADGIWPAKNGMECN